MNVNYKFFLICVSLLFSCYGNFIFSSATENYKIVENTSEPKNGIIDVELFDEFTIESGKNSEVFGYISKIELDEKDNIYLLDSNRHKIISFDKNGKFRFEFGRKGEGPGDLKNPKDFFVSNKNIFVLGYRIIHFFSNDGSFKKNVIMNSYINNFFVSKNNIILSYSIFNRNTKEVAIGSFDLFGGEKKELKKYFFENIVTKRSGKRNIYYQIPHSFKFSLCFSRINNSKIVFGFSDDYSLFILNSDGKIILNIKKVVGKIPITSKTKKKVTDRLIKKLKSWSGNIIKRSLQLPDYYPFFSEIISDEKERLYVLNVQKDESLNEKYIYDVFNKNGIYIHKIVLSKRPEVIRNGYLYFTDYDEMVLKRYKIKNWGSIK